jgi:hypothetical protein
LLSILSDVINLGGLVIPRHVVQCELPKVRLRVSLLGVASLEFGSPIAFHPHVEPCLKQLHRDGLTLLGHVELSNIVQIGLSGIHVTIQLGDVVSLDALNFLVGQSTILFHVENLIVVNLFLLPLFGQLEVTDWTPPHVLVCR